MPQILAIGEAMIELAGAGGDAWRLGVAGDTLNTAWYLRALLPPGWAVDYLTRLGTDPFSDRIAGCIAQAGIGTARVQRDPHRGPGLYAITLDGGERRFTYWRGQSAARHLADDPAEVAQALAGADLVYLSGITLAILAPDRRAALLDAVAASSAALAYDPDFRPRLWDSATAARDWTTRAARLARWVLPSADDEAACFGDADPAATLARHAALGVPEVAVKNAGGPIHLWDGAAHVLDDLPRAAPLDSTGAGDAFNAGYLAARLTGADAPDAARAGHALSARVVLGYGALVPQALDQPR